MLLRLCAISLAAAACAEPVVEMQIVLPSNAGTFDASCVTGISVLATGGEFASDRKDVKASCKEIESQSRLGGIHDAIRGTFTLTIPDSGLSGVQIFGWSGPAPCMGNALANDLIFQASDAYIGQDTLELKLETTLDCAKSTVRVKPVDLFALISGATPSSDNCTAASVTPALDPDSWSSIGQIRKYELAPAVEYFGGVRGAPVDASGIASFSAATTGMTKACLAYDTSGAIGYGTGCVLTGNVCAGASDIEAPFIERGIANEALTFDDALLAKWDSVVFVSVWNSASPKKAPLAGATLQLAATDGQVVYVDPPAAGSKRLVRRADNATGPSGLALVYTNKLANVTVHAGGSSRTVTVASPDWSFGAALVVMP